MAVGSRFMDAETQAAIAEQSGQPAAQAQAAEPAATEAALPQGEVNAETDTSADQQTTKQVETPESGQEDSTKQGADADTQDVTTDMNDVALPSQEEVDAALAQAGFSNDDLGKELADNDGKLTEDTVKALKEKFDPAAVDNAVKDMETQYATKTEAADEAQKESNVSIDDMNTFIYESLAGGDAAKGADNLQVLSDWAKANMDAAELKAINAKLASGNKDVVKEGLQTAVTLWKKGQERPMMTGDSDATAAAAAQAAAAPAFEPLSKDGFIKIQMTKKYQEDPEYALTVDNRRRKTINGGDNITTPEYNAKFRPSI